MRTSLLYKYILYILFACLCERGTAQNSFEYRAELDKVRSAGFYEIVLLPPLTAKLQAGLQDIRIISAEGQQVPYMLRSDVLSAGNTSFKELRILSNRKQSDTLNQVIVENNLKQAISSLVLFVNTTDRTRHATIAGSDNNKDWNVIKASIVLNTLFTNSSESIAQELSFPGSKYQFFKLTMHGTRRHPLDILKVCTSASGPTLQTNYIPIQPPSIQQKDSSDGSTVVKLHFSDVYLINKLTLKVSGGKFFRRTMHIYNKDALLNENGPLLLSSNAPATYFINAKTNELSLKINNEDNPPLKIDEVSAFQLKWYLLTWLEEGSGYKLVFGDPGAKAPEYDLEFFKDSVRSAPASLKYRNPVRNETFKQKEPATLFNNKTIMWGVIVVVLVILLLFTFKLTKEVSGKK